VVVASYKTNHIIADVERHVTFTDLYFHVLLKLIKILLDY